MRRSDSARRRAGSFLSLVRTDPRARVPRRQSGAITEDWMRKSQQRRRSAGGRSGCRELPFPPILAQRLKRIERLAGVTVVREDLAIDAIDYYLTTARGLRS
jgi:hypothetical protein